MNKKLIYLLTASICTLAFLPTYAADGDLNVTGSLGVGTTSPVSKLHVKGNTELQGNVFFGDPSDSGTDRGVLSHNGTYFYILSALGQKLNLGSNYDPDRLVIDTNGNVGIGTTDPQARLHVSGSEICLTGTQGNVSAKISDGGTNDPGYLRLYSGGAEATTQIGQSATWFVAGNVGIGTRNPTSTLHVDGTFAVTSTKNFEIDHPTKPGQILVHACVEGPEAAVYYRGEGRLRKGQATVILPEYFEALTRPEGRTVQLTAKGPEPYLLSSSAVANGQFTVYGAKKNEAFYWEVKAVRADVEPLVVEKAKQLAKEGGNEVATDSSPEIEPIQDPESVEFIKKLKEKAK